MSYLDLVSKKYSKGADNSLTQLTEDHKRLNVDLTTLTTDSSVSYVSAYVGGIKYIIYLSELMTEANGDWGLIKDSPKLIEDLARLIQTRRLIKQGERPPHYTKKALCQHCGPVWLWVEGQYQGCPWCFARASGVDIPRPTTY